MLCYNQDVLWQMGLYCILENENVPAATWRDGATAVMLNTVLQVPAARFSVVPNI